MKEIKVWLYDRMNTIIFEGVEEFYETRKALSIVQYYPYKTVTTTLYKQSIQMYEVTNTI